MDTRGGGPKDKSTPSSSPPVDVVPSYANEFKGIRDYKTGMVGSFRPSSAPVPESKHPYRYHSGVDHKKLYYEADSIGDEDAPDELVHVLSDNLFTKYHGLLDDSVDDDDDKKKHGDGGGSDGMKKNGIGVALMTSHHVQDDHGAVADVDEPDQTAADEVGNDPYKVITYGDAAYGGHGDKNDDDDDGGNSDHINHGLKCDHFKNLYRPKTAPELLTPGVALTGIIQYKKKNYSPPPRRTMSKVKSDLESAMRFDSFHLRNFDKAMMVDDKKPSSLQHTHVCNIRIPLSSPTMNMNSSPTMSPTSLKEHRPLRGSTDYKKPHDVDYNNDYKNDNKNNDFTPEMLRIKRSQPDFSPESLGKRYPSRVASKLIHAIYGSSRRIDKQQQLQQEMDSNYNHRFVTTATSISATVLEEATGEEAVDISSVMQTDRKNSENDVAIIEATSVDRSKDVKKLVTIRDILNDKELFRKPLYPYISLNAARATRQWESKRSTAEALLESYKSSINSPTTGQLVDSDVVNTVEKPMVKKKKKKRRKKIAAVTVDSSPSKDVEEEIEKERVKEVVVMINNNIVPDDNIRNMDSQCQEIPTTALTMVIADVPTFVVTSITEANYPNNGGQESIIDQIDNVVSSCPSAVAGIVPEASVNDESQAIVDDKVGQTSVTDHILPPFSNEKHGNSLAAIITAWNVQDDATKSIISDTSSYHDEFELIWSSLMDVKGDNDDLNNVISTIEGDANFIPIEEEEDIVDDTHTVDHIVTTQSDLLPSLVSVPDNSIMNNVAVDDSLNNLVKDAANHEESIDRIVVPSSMDALVHEPSSMDALVHVPSSMDALVHVPSSMEVLVHVKSSNQILREKIDSLKRKPSMRKGQSNDSMLNVKDVAIGLLSNRTEESSLNRSEETSSEPATSRSSPHRYAQLGNYISNDKATSIFSEMVLQQHIFVSNGIGIDDSDAYPTVVRSETPATVVESCKVATPFSLVRSTAHPLLNENSIAPVSVINKSYATTEVALKAVEFDTPLSFGGSEDMVFEHLRTDEMRISNDDALYMEEFDLVTSDSLDYHDSSFLKSEDFDISIDKSVDQKSSHQLADELKDMPLSTIVARPLDEVYKEDLNEFFTVPEGTLMDESKVPSGIVDESEIPPTVVVIVESKKHLTNSAEHESNGPEFIVSSIVELESEVPTDPVLENDFDVSLIMIDKSEVPPLAEDESEGALTVEDQSEGASIVINESEVAPIVEDQSEVPPIVVDESEVAPMAQDESEVPPIAVDESEVTPIVVDYSEGAPIDIDESEDVPTVGNESEVALTVKDDSEGVPLIVDDSDVTHVLVDESEGAPTVIDDSEVYPTAENEYEVVAIAENESEVAPIDVDEYEEAPIDVDESEEAPIDVDESEVAHLSVDEYEDFLSAKDESEVVVIAENESAVTLIAENESEVPSISENKSEVAPIAVESKDVPIVVDESNVLSIAEDESEEPPIAQDESEGPPMAQDESEGALTVEDQSEGAPTVINESEVVHIVVDESLVAPIESEVAPLAENKSEVLPIAVAESNVLPMAENESDDVHIAENESEDIPLVADESEDVHIAENDSEDIPLKADESEDAHIAENESEDIIPLVEDESNVLPIAENESEDIPLVADESNVLPIAENESEVAPIVKDESEDIPLVEDESEDIPLVEDELEVAFLTQDELEVLPIAEDESEVAPIVKDESKVSLILADKHEVSPIVVVDANELTAKIQDSASRRVVVPLLQLPTSVVNELKRPPRIDQSHSSDLHIESRDSFITGTGTNSVDYDHWKSRDDSLFEDSQSIVYSEEDSSQYSSNLKLDSMVFLSQALLHEVSYDMVNSAIASVPITTSPYALTMSFPVNFFVPILTYADQMLAITKEQQISNTQYATYMLDISSCDDLVVSIYNDLSEMDFEDMLVPENLVFQSGLDENFLLHLSNSVGWGRFSETDADMSSCYLRGSIIRIDDALKLVLRLWHNFISWTVQTVPMHAALIEVVESALSEIHGIVPDHGQSWEDDMLALLDSGRMLHKKFIDEIIVKDDLKNMLEKWEFDPRRSIYNDSSASLGIEVAEDIVLVEFRTLSIELYQKLCEQSIDLPADENNEFKLSKYVLQDLIDNFRSKTVDIIMRFYENLEIISSYNSTIEDYLKSSIDMIFQSELQVYRTHDWNAYYEKRGRLLTLLESSTYEGDIMKATKDAFDDFIYNNDGDDIGDDNGNRKHASAIEFIQSFKNDLGTLIKIAVTPPTIKGEVESDVVPIAENKLEVPPTVKTESEMLRSDFDFGTIDIVQNNAYMDLAFGDDRDDDDDDDESYQYSKGWSQSQGSSPGSMHSNLESSPSLLDPTSPP